MASNDNETASHASIITAIQGGWVNRSAAVAAEEGDEHDTGAGSGRGNADSGNDDDGRVSDGGSDWRAGEKAPAMEADVEGCRGGYGGGQPFK